MLWEEWKTQEMDTSSNRSFSSVCAKEAKSEKEGQWNWGEAEEGKIRKKKSGGGMGGNDNKISKLEWKEREEGRDWHREQEIGRAHTKDTQI